MIKKVYHKPEGKSYYRDFDDDYDEVKVSYVLDKDFFNPKVILRKLKEEYILFQIIIKITKIDF